MAEDALVSKKIVYMYKIGGKKVSVITKSIAENQNQ